MNTKMKKARNSYISPSRLGATADKTPDKFGKVGYILDVIAHAKFEIKRSVSLILVYI
jgi:hypothetical protein